jgi:tetratricopeptide (TPR) repeat protein
MKKLNVKFATMLLLGMIVVPAMTFLLWRFQVGRNASNLIDRANIEREDEDYREAIRLQERYLAYQSEDSDQLCQLALDYLLLIDTNPDNDVNRLDIGRAYSRCEEALRQVPDHHDLRKKTCDFMVQIGRYGDAVDHLELMRSSLATEFDSASVVQLARCMILIGDPDSAKGELYALLGFDPQTNSFDDQKATAPDNIDAYLSLATLYRRDFEPELAESLMDQAVRANPDNHKAFLERSKSILRYSTGEDRLERAKADIERALDLSPDDGQVLLTAAGIAASDGDFLTAEAHLKHGIQEHPENVALIASRSDVAQMQGKPEEAMKWLEQGLEENLLSPILMLKKCEHELAQKDVEAARDSLEILRSLDTRTDWVNYLEVRMLMVDGHWRRASRQLEEIMNTLIARNPQLATQVYLSLAQCYENLGDWDLAISAADSVPSDSPQKLSAVLVKAQSFLAKRQYDRAIESYRTIYESEGAAEKELNSGIFMTFFVLLTSNQASLPEEEQDWTECQEVLQHITADDSVAEPRKWAAYAELLAAQNKHDEALALVRKHRKTSPDDQALKVFERKLAEKLGETITETEEMPDSPRMRLSTAASIVGEGSDDVKQALLQQEEGIEAWPVEDQIQLKYGLVALHISVNLPGNHVRRLLLEIAEADPEDMKCRSQLFTLSLIGGNEAQMDAALRMIEELEGTESNEWKLAQARWLTWSYSNQEEDGEKLQDARNLMRDIQENRPNWPDLLRLQTQVSILLEDHDSAEDFLNRLIDSGQDDPKVIQKLATLYLETNRPGAAREVIARLPKESRPKWANQKLIDLNTESASIADIDNVVPSDSDDAVDVLWKGKALTRHNHLQAATKAFRRVTELKPRSPEGWLSLVENLYQVGQHRAAEDAMRNARINLSETFAHITLARCYEIASNQAELTTTQRSLHIARAEQFYLQALENGPDDRSVLQKSAAFYVSINRRKSALQQIDRLLEGVEPYDTDADSLTTWARRSKAALLSASGSFQDYMTAVDEIRKNVPTGARLGPDDLRILAQITLSRADSLSHKKVIQDFEDFQQERKLTDEEQILLANLYDRVGRNDDSEKLLYDLLATNPDNLQVVSMLIEMLVKQKRNDQAKALLRKLPASSLHRVRVTTLLMAEEGKEVQAEKQLLRLLPKPISRLPESQNELLRSVSGLLEEIERYSSSEKILREYVRRVPRNTLLLASFLSRREGLDNLDQVLELCNQGLKKGVFGLHDVTEIAVTALRLHLGELADHEVKEKYFSQVSDWFQQGPETLIDSHTMVLQLAEFETMRGNTDQVVGLYREFLAGEDLLPLHRAIVQNNLAYVLALDKKGVESLQLIEEAIQHLGPTSSLLDTRAMAKIATGNYPDAKNDLNRAIDDDETAAFRFHLAYVQSLERNSSAAESELRQAIQLGLKPHHLHPFERDIFQRLVQDLGLESVVLN